MYGILLLGWPPNNTHEQPSNHSGQDCITLARRFYDEKYQAKDVGYYFWNDAPCTVRLPFVCEKVAKSDGEEFLSYFVQCLCSALWQYTIFENFKMKLSSFFFCCILADIATNLSVMYMQTCKIVHVVTVFTFWCDGHFYVMGGKN